MAIFLSKDLMEAFAEPTAREQSVMRASGAFQEASAPAAAQVAVSTPAVKARPAVMAL